MTECYMCNQTATTVDHLPPKVFFPEHKDLKAQLGSDTEDLRINLITVPACAKHNNAFSSDDEYCAYAIASSALSNPIGLTQWKTKVLRALQRSPRLQNLFTTNAQKVTVNGTETIAYPVDRLRLTGVMERIARGLYFNEKKTKLAGDLVVSFPGLAYIDGNTNQEVLLTILCRNFDRFPWKGANPRVFKYQMHELGTILVIRFHFYEGFEVIVTRKI